MSRPPIIWEGPYPAEFVDIDLRPADFNRLIVNYFNVVDDNSVIPAPGTLLTMYLGFGDPIVWHEGPYHFYNTTGISNFPSEPNPLFPQPYAIGHPQFLNMGFRIGVDTGSRIYQGVCGEAKVFCAGGVGGNAVPQSYVASSWQGAIGGYSNPSYFPGDPPGTLVDHAIQLSFSGHYDGARGQIPSGLRFRMDGGGTHGSKIISGRIEVQPLGAGSPATPPPPPPPPPAYSYIGNFMGGYSLERPLPVSPSDAFWYAGPAPIYSGANSAWAGFAWDTPVAPEAITPYSTDGEGFIFGHDPSINCTLELFGSDTLPVHELDGVLLDSWMGLDSFNLGIPLDPGPTPYPYHWVRISHTLSPRSIYLAAIHYTE